jgi:hypothetical protein
MNRTVETLLQAAAAAALRPDPLPEPPGWLTPEQRSIWLCGARKGIAQGRRLAAAEAADGWPLVAPPEV